MQSDRRLLLWYNVYNKKYFGDELTRKIELIWEPVPLCDGEACPIWELADGIFLVKIDPAHKGNLNYARLVLLHEMCHLAIWQKHTRHQHGPLFRNEQNRIYALGALRKIW
jgi:hypothetical protein